MRKKLAVAALVTALAASQAMCTFAAGSTSTAPVITSGGGGSSSGGGSGNGGKKYQSSNPTMYAGTGMASTSAGNDTISIASSNGGVTTNSRGQAVVGDTAIEFVQGSDHAVVGLPESVVASINGINSGSSLNGLIVNLDLAGYNALIGTHAIMTRDSATNAEKVGAVEVPLYIPNLVDGLGTVQVLFYDNMLSQWRLLSPVSVDVASKTIKVSVPNSGTLTVVYKR